MNPYQYQTVEGDFKLRKVSTEAGSQKYGPCEYCNKSADTIYSFSLDQECKWITDDPILFALRGGNLNFVKPRGSLFAHSTCGDEWAERTKARLKSADRPASTTLGGFCERSSGNGNSQQGASQKSSLEAC